MANVLTILKLTPSDPELNREEFVNNVVKKLADDCHIDYLKFDEEPLAFGIFIINVYFKNSDSSEGSENINKLEELLGNQKELQNVEMGLQSLTDH